MEHTTTVTVVIAASHYNELRAKAERAEQAEALLTKMTQHELAGWVLEMRAEGQGMQWRCAYCSVVWNLPIDALVHADFCVIEAARQMLKLDPK